MHPPDGSVLVMVYLLSLFVTDVGRAAVFYGTVYFCHVHKVLARPYAVPHTCTCSTIHVYCTTAIIYVILSPFPHTHPSSFSHFGQRCSVKSPSINTMSSSTSSSHSPMHDRANNKYTFPGDLGTYAHSLCDVTIVCAVCRFNAF